MKNQNLSLFKKGNFKRIDTDFMLEGYEALQELQIVQEKYKKNDTDTFINELRDSITGYTLNFNLINVEKHGFDCKMDDKDIYLEVKAASFSSNQWQATFNDTTFEKAEAFKDEKVYLALSVWKNASDLLFICFGQNEKLGEFLEEKIKWFKEGHTVRSTQTISLQHLVFDYGFKILAVNKSAEETLALLRLKSKNFNALSKDEIISIKDFKGIDEYSLQGSN